MTWGPAHSDLDLRVFCEDGVNIGVKEDGGILGWMWGGVKDHLQGRRGVAMELNFCDGGTVVEFPADEV